MFISNLDSLTRTLDKAGMPPHFIVQCKQMAEQGHAEFTLPYHGTFDTGAFFLRAGFRTQENQIQYLGFKITCIDPFVFHRYASGIDTGKLAELISKVHEPSQMARYKDATPALEQEAKRTIEEAMQLLSREDPMMYFALMVGFQLPLPIASRLRPAYEKFLYERTRHCWFNHDQGLDANGALKLMITADRPSAILLGKHPASGQRDVWITIDHQHRDETGRVQLLTFGREHGFDLMGQLQQFNLDLDSRQLISLMAMLAGGNLVQIDPRNHGHDRVIRLLADPKEKEIAVYDVEGKKLAAFLFYHQHLKPAEEQIAGVQKKNIVKGKSHIRRFPLPFFKIRSLLFSDKVKGRIPPRRFRR